MRAQAVIDTDGACIGAAAARPGGWAAVIVLDGTEQVIGGSHPATTITAMELTAVVRALQAVPPGSIVTVRTDSASVIVGITERLPWWRSRGWRTMKRRKVPNRELWQALASLVEAREVTWAWVKGHSGDRGNERVDELARAQARGQADGRQLDASPRGTITSP
jgi:ribonuclease HI